MSLQAGDLIVLDDPLIANNPNVAGAVVFWRLSGTTDLDDLRRAWDAAGLDRSDLPREVSPEVAAHRTVKEFQTADRKVKRMDVDGDRHTWLLVGKTRDYGSVIEQSVECRVTFDTWIRVSPLGHPLATDINEAFDRALRELSTTDISTWLVKQAMAMHALPLRDTGGVYFLPRQSMRRWRRIVEAVRQATKHVVMELPSLKTAEAISAITEALAAEANEASKALEAELLSGDLGSRALRTREERCVDMLSKIAGYENLLGQQMTTLKARVEALQAEVVAATLAAEAAEDEKENG